MPDADPPISAAELEARRRELVDGVDIEQLRTWEVFDDVAEALALEAETPRAEVKLTYGDHFLVLGGHGTEAETLPRTDSLCNHPVDNGETLVVENALEDPQLADHPSVTGTPQIRFYVGLPLIVDDTPIGSVCAYDSEPSTLEWRSRPAIFRMVGLVERVLEAHLRGDSLSRLLIPLISAEAHAIQLACTGDLDCDEHEELRSLRTALHRAEQWARDNLAADRDASIGDAPTLPEGEAE